MADGFDFNFSDFNLGDMGGGSSYAGLSDMLRSGGGSEAFSGLSEAFSGLTATPGGAGADWAGLASDIFGGLKNYGLPALQAGTGLMSIGAGIRGGIQSGQTGALQQQALRRQMDLSKLAQQEAKPLADFSQAQLGAAQQGQIPPAMQAQIDQWKQAAKQRVMQMAAASGQGESSQLQAWLSWIDQQAVMMGQGALQDEIRQGIAAGGVSGNVLGTGAAAAGGAGYQAAQEQGGFQQAIEAANAALARLG